MKQEQKDAFEQYKEENKDNVDTYKLYKKFKQQQKEIDAKNEDEYLWRNFNEGEVTGNY